MTKQTVTYFKYDSNELDDIRDFLNMCVVQYIESGSLKISPENDKILNRFLNGDTTFEQNIVHKFAIDVLQPATGVIKGNELEAAALAKTAPETGDGLVANQKKYWEYKTDVYRTQIKNILELKYLVTGDRYFY